MRRFWSLSKLAIAWAIAALALVLLAASVYSFHRTVDFPLYASTRYRPVSDPAVLERLEAEKVLSRGEQARQLHWWSFQGGISRAGLFLNTSRQTTLRVFDERPVPPDVRYWRVRQRSASSPNYPDDGWNAHDSASRFGFPFAYLAWAYAVEPPDDTATSEVTFVFPAPPIALLLLAWPLQRAYRWTRARGQRGFEVTAGPATPPADREPLARG